MLESHLVVGTEQFTKKPTTRNRAMITAQKKQAQTDNSQDYTDMDSVLRLETDHRAFNFEAASESNRETVFDFGQFKSAALRATGL